MKNNDRMQSIKTRLIEIENERQDLITELNELQKKQIIPLYGNPIRKSIPENRKDKIELFFELFACRTDVFPKLWENMKKRIKGYSPVCINEWKQGLCNKPKIKCSNCPNRDFQSLDIAIIEAHLTGKITIGSYSIRSDDTCLFLAADFDNTGWETDVISYKEAGNRMGVPIYIEKSRSGHGAHAWIFFQGAIQARKARQLGTVILTEASKENMNLSLKSYDRFFPNQDYIPKAGFGNLIALPLQKKSYLEGNTLFLDENLVPYESQWELMSSIMRLNTEEVDEILATVSNSVTDINIYETEDIRIKEAETGLNIDFDELNGIYTEKVRLHLGAMINIDISTFPVRLVLALKRIATFANPDFFKKQKMRFSTWNIPKYITCCELVNNVLRIPRALIESVEEILQMAGAKIVLEDNRNSLSGININFTGELDGNQKAAVTEILNHDYSVLVAPTGSGKTIMAIYLLAVRKVPTLILVHRKQLINQWREQLDMFTDFDKKDIGIIGSGKKKSTGVVDIAMLQTLSKSNNINDFIKNYEQVIIDECHHIPAPSFDSVLSKLPVRYSIGLTATPFRKDGHHPILYMLSGPIRYELKEIQDDQITRIVFTKETEFTMPAEYGEKPPIHEIWNNLVVNEERLAYISTDILNEIGEKRNPLILSERKDHLENLRRKISELSDKKIEILMFTGDLGKKKRQENMDIIKSCIQNSKPYCILSTGSLIGEGFDLPELDTLFLTMPISFRGRIIQYAGRLHRKHEGKSEIHIYDYVDATSGLTISMFKKRVVTYRKMNYEIICDSAKIKRWL